MIAIAALVDRGNIVGIKQVVGVQLQVERAVYAITNLGIGNPVAVGGVRRADGTVFAAMHAADVAGTCADGNRVGSLVLAPQGEGMLRRIRQ